MITIYELNPHLLSKLFSEQRWDELWDYVISVLKQIHGTKANDKARLAVEHDYEDPERRPYIQNFSKLLSEFLIAILSEPSSKMNDEMFYDIIEYHEAIHTLFHVAGMQDTDVIVERMLNQEGRLDFETQKKALILLRLDTQQNLVALLKKTLRKYHLPMVMIFLSYSRVDGGVHDNKIHVLSIGKHIDELPPHKSVFKYVSRAFFYVSYLYYPNKHEIKKNMNRYIEQYLKKFIINSQKIREAKAIGEINKKSRQKDKPVLLLYSEFFKKDHALYRSWGQRVMLLRESFDIHLLVDESQYDESMNNDFSNVYTCNPSRINEAIYKIYELAPDFIFYPSLGMTSPGMVFSNMRFCEVQGMGLGQPATTMSNKIDFIIAHEQYASKEAFPRDCFVGDTMPPVFAMRDDHVRIMKNNSEQVTSCDKKNAVNVAIVGTHFKLTGPFLSLVSEMLTQADFKVNLTFLISGVGLGHIFLSEYLSNIFPGCTVKGFQEFSDYINDIKACDLMLCPFPFGHSNTIFDALVLGKPCVSLYGEQPHNRTESVILDRVGLKDDFVCYDFDQYKAKFFELSQDILNGKTVFYDARSVMETLTTPPENYDYARNFLWAYHNIRKIKAYHNEIFYPEKEV